MTPTTSSPSSAQKRKIKTIDNVRYHLQIFEFCAALCERGASGAIDENASRELIQWVRDEYKSLNSAMVERTLRFIAANEECSFKNVRWKISKEASRVIERELAGVPILYCTALVASRNDAPCASPAKKEFGYKFCGRHAPRCEFSEESGNRCTYKAIFGRKCCERHKIFEEDMAREPEPKEVSSDEREGKTLCKLCNRSCGKNSTKYGQFCNVHIRLTENYEFSDHFKFEKFRPSEKNPILETRIRELDEFALATFQLKKVPKNFRKKVLDLLNIKKMSYQDVDLTVYSQGVVLAYPNPEEHQKGKSYEKYAFGAETSIKQLRASSEKFSLKFGNVVKYFYCESETVRKEVVHLITRLTDKNASDETKNAVRKPKNYTDWLNPIRERAEHLNEKKDKDKKRAQILHDLFERNLPVKEAKGEGEGEEGEEKGEQHEEYSWYDKELTIETTTSEGKEIKEYWWGVARNERSGRRIGTEKDFGNFKKQLNEILKLPVEIGVSKAVDGTEGGKGDDRRNNGGGGGGGGDDDADDGDGNVGGSNYYELKWLDDIEKYANDEICAVNCQDAQSRRDRVKYLTNELFTGERGERGEQLLKPLNSMQNEKDLYYYWKPHQKIGTSEEHLVEFSKRLDTMFPSYFVGRKRGDSTTLSGTYIHEEQNRPPWKDSPKQCWKLLCDKNYRNKGLLAEKWKKNEYLQNMEIPAELDDSTGFAEYEDKIPICKFRVDMYGNVVQHPDIGDSSTLCSTEVDHVLPWSRGGLSTPKSGNIQLISWFANRRKSNKFLHGPLYVNGWGKENSEEERLDVGISVELFISLFECVATLYYENASKKKNRLRGAKLLQSPYGKLVMTLLTKRTFITKPPKILDDANDATCLPDEKPIGDTIKILNKAKKEKNAKNNYQGYYLLEELLSKAMFARGFEKEDEQAEIRRIYNLVRDKKEDAMKENYNHRAPA